MKSSMKSRIHFAAIMAALTGSFAIIESFSVHWKRLQSPKDKENALNKAQAKRERKRVAKINHKYLRGH